MSIDFQAEIHQLLCYHSFFLLAAVVIEKFESSTNMANLVPYKKKEQSFSESGSFFKEWSSESGESGDMYTNWFLQIMVTNTIINFRLFI